MTKRDFIVPVVMFFACIFLALMLTYGMASPAEEVTAKEAITALLSFISFPIIGFFLVIKGRKAMGHIVSLASPFVGAATFLLIKSL